MKIIKSGEVIAEMPNKPRNFDGGCKGSTVFINTVDRQINLATYDTFKRASEVSAALRQAYLKNADEFVLPDD